MRGSCGASSSACTSTRLHCTAEKVVHSTFELLLCTCDFSASRHGLALLLHAQLVHPICAFIKCGSGHLGRRWEVQAVPLCLRKRMRRTRSNRSSARNSTHCTDPYQDKSQTRVVCLNTDHFRAKLPLCAMADRAVHEVTHLLCTSFDYFESFCNPHRVLSGLSLDITIPVVVLGNNGAAACWLPLVCCCCCEELFNDTHDETLVRLLLGVCHDRSRHLVQDPLENLLNLSGVAQENIRQLQPLG